MHIYQFVSLLSIMLTVGLAAALIIFLPKIAPHIIKNKNVREYTLAAVNAGIILFFFINIAAFLPEAMHNAVPQSFFN